MRRGEAKPLGVALDLSGAFSRKICRDPVWGKENEAPIVLMTDFKHHVDLKMYSRLPDYDDFQRYDLGMGVVLSQIAHKMYANFHKPSWQTSKHHLFTAEIPKKLHIWLKAFS